MATDKKAVGIGRRGTPLERVILNESCAWLQEQGVFFWRSNNIPVFAAGGANNQGKYRFHALPKYTPRGLPDIMALVSGKFIGIECKRVGAKLRPEQAQFGARLVMNGGKYIVVHSLDELKTLI